MKIKDLLTDASGNRYRVFDFIDDWNDDPCRTFEEVKSLVEKLDI